MNVWIGTAGFSYQEWLGGFYPPDLPDGRMFSYYSRRFPFVELNFTFYGCPSADVFVRYARTAPEGFRFSAKVPQSASHEQSYRDLDRFRDAVGHLGGALSAVALQFPQSFAHSTSGRKWVELVVKSLDPLPVGVEFRHWTWARPDIPTWLTEQGAFLIAVDVPDLAALYPRGLVRAGRTIYVRFHSRNVDNWYKSDRERHDYEYSESALAAWADAVELEAPVCDEVFFVFNNCRHLQALDNARLMARLLEGRLGLNVVQSTSTPQPEQLSLFE